MEPDFLSQTAEPMDATARRTWFSKQAREAEAQGATWHRFSIHPERRELSLYEGWKVRPDDEGPHWFKLPAAEAS